MEAPVRRRARLLAASVLLTTTCALLFTLSPPAHAEPDPEVSTTEPTEPTVTTEPPPPPPPTSDAPTTEAPPPPTTEAPPPPPRTRKLTVGASNVELGGAYWQGDGKAKLVISVQNGGEIREKITGSYAFPGGSQHVTVADAYGTDGCNPDGPLQFNCNLPPGGLGYVVVTVTVGPDAWKLTGTGTVTAQMENYPIRQRNFALTFTPPPVPGIELTTDRPSLPAQPTPAVEQTSLAVKLRNTGSAKAGGAIELVTPPGVDVISFPAVCKVKKRISAERDRCEVGDIAAGKDVVAVFGLSVSASAHAELPLTGAVHGYLTPAGRAPIETRTDYTILGPPPAGESAMPTAAPPSPVAMAATAPGQRQPASGGMLTSERLSSLPFVGGIIGLVALVGFLVVFSLRRRLRDESEVPAAVEDEPVASVPAPRRSDESLPSLPTRSPIPRSLTLPRLPSGPVAGSGFREKDE